MPRPKSFDEDNVLTCAMMTFWHLGYDATTYRVLESETGVGVRSMHNTFGEKDDLFDQALARYHLIAKNVIDQVFDPPGVSAIQMMFQSMVMPKEPEDIANSGCLMVNTVFEVPEKPAEIEARIQAYRQMWIDTFQAALSADDVPEADARAEFLLGALWGILSQIRLTGRTEAAAPMSKVIVETVESWR